MSKADIMIIAGEASGDLHGARLVEALKKLSGNLTFCGIGGKELLARGMEPLYDVSKLSVVGISEVLTHLRDILEAKNTLEKRLRLNPPKLLILIDFPDFNLMIAKKAKKYKVPVFYYISPQVWAWRSGRVKKIARLVDRLAVILPFEQEFYRQRGVDVDFVGHPLLDSIKPSMSKPEFLTRHGISSSSKLVGILPGSRRKEVETTLPVFLQAADMLAAEISDVTFLCPLAPTLNYDDLARNGLKNSKLNIKVISGDRYDLMAACDAVMAVSGTVTLELAILNVPMIVAYRISPLTHFFGKLLIKVKYASLANLVAGREIVPELLQNDMTPEAIYENLFSLLTDKKENKKMRDDLENVCKAFGGGGASRRAAKIALSLM